MQPEKQIEPLKGLPGYGPMYVSVSPDPDVPYVSEGYVLRMFNPDGTNWVANFRPGWTNCSVAFDFPDEKLIVVVAGGQGYLMSPGVEKPISTFGGCITDVLQTAEGSLIFADGLQIFFFDRSTGQLWVSERISWDGMKDLAITGETLYGKAYDPTSAIREWCDFSMNLKTKEIVGGSFLEFLRENPGLEEGEDGMLRKKGEK